MPPASRITDMHVCPMLTGPVPHVGGPILPPGGMTVLIGDDTPHAVVDGQDYWFCCAGCRDRYAA